MGSFRTTLQRGCDGAGSRMCVTADRVRLSHRKHNGVGLTGASNFFPPALTKHSHSFYSPRLSLCEVEASHYQGTNSRDDGLVSPSPSVLKLPEHFCWTPFSFTVLPHISSHCPPEIFPLPLFSTPTLPLSVREERR